MAYLRVWSGTLAAKTQFTIARTDETERIGDLLEIQGKDMHAIDQAVAGDLVAVAKIDDIQHRRHRARRGGDTGRSRPSRRRSRR